MRIPVPDFLHPGFRGPKKITGTLAKCQKKIREKETTMWEPVGLLQLKVNFRKVARGARDLQDGEVTLRPQLQLGGRLPLLAAQGGGRLHSLAVQPVLT